MPRSTSHWRRLPILLVVFGIVLVQVVGMVQPARASNSPQAFPFSQNWANTGLITVNDDWSGVPGVVGFLGQDITTATGTDPQTLLGVSSVANDVDVIANQANPNTNTTGGVAEFEIADPVIALQGSGTADAPNVIFYLNTTQQSNITVAYHLRDIDGSADNAIQPVALQYRVGSSGNFTNVPAGFVADATSGPSLATLVTAVNAVLPAAANNQPEVQVRVITANAVGSDEWVGVDDIAVTGTPIVGDTAPAVDSTSPVNGAANVATNSNITITFSESVNVTGSAFGVECPAGTPVGFTNITGSGPSTSFTLDPTSDLPGGATCTVTVTANQVSDADATDPPDNLAASYNFSFTTVTPVVAGALVVNEIDYDQAGTDTAEFVEIKNNDSVAVNLDPYNIVMLNGGSAGAIYRTIDLPNVALAAGDYYVVCANAGTVANCDLDSTPDTDWVQNGAPDAVALRFNTTIIDAVSYEGNTTGATEGSGAGLEDTAASGAPESISRCPDGADTNQNNVDFSLHLSTPGATNICVAVDPAPTVSSTVPANGATSMAPAVNIDITFSEPVNVTGSAFAIECPTGTPVGFTNTTGSGPAISFTLDPTSDLPSGTICTVRVTASQVSDADTNDPLDNMVADFSFSFTTGTVQVCGNPFTPIYQIQGSGPSVPAPGDVTTEGVVVGDFEGSTGLGGFYMQDPAGDGDTNTSDGIFVYTGNADTVSMGQRVRITGFARERFNQTSINGANSDNAALPPANILNCGTGSLPNPVDVTLPLPNAIYLERFEGMRINFPQTLSIAEYFNYARFGEIILAYAGGIPELAGHDRLYTPTAIVAPGSQANSLAAQYELRQITLDDGLSIQNPSNLRHPNGDPFSLSNRFRGGDTLQNVVGVLGFDFSVYRIQPTGPAAYTAANPRQAQPEGVGGRIRVGTFNTLNYFLTGDAIQDDSGTNNPADDVCGGGANLECRGWDTDQPTEFQRQRDKLLQAIIGLDADALGLNELENTPNAEPLADIVAGLNAILGPGTYDYIHTGTIGTDAIKVGIIYKPAVLRPAGSHAILNSSVDPRFVDTKSRPSLAQTFDEISTGARFTLVINHLKSKGSDCNDLGDPDAGDGQGNCNGTRKRAAQAIVDWIASDPTSSGDPDFLVLGDMNSYAQEDPITALRAGSDDILGTSDDLTNLISTYQGAFAYSYVFDGQLGYLDHALANASILSQVTGAADWHINADEPNIFDYDTTFKPAAQEALYEPNAYRTSDHDPVVVGLSLTLPPAAPVANTDSYVVNEDAMLTEAAPGVLGNDTDVNNDTLTAVLVTSTSHGVLSLDPNGSFTYTPAANYNGPDSFTYKANDGTADSSVATVDITVTPVNDSPAAVNDSYNATEDTPLTIPAPGVLANDSDVDGDTVTASAAGAAGFGTAVVGADGALSYTPNANFCGPDNLSYTVSDGNGGTATATVSITVACVNDAPVASGQSVTTAEDTAKGITLAATDADGNALSYSIVSGPSHGTLSGSAPNLSYTPALNYNGSDSFTFKANDGTADSNVATVDITVTPVNDSPSAVNDTLTVLEDALATTVNVLANDTDVDGDTLTVTSVSQGSKGAVTLNAGTVTYKPNANANGADSFTYTISDGHGGSATATVNVTITSVNDPPVAQNDLATTKRNTAVLINVRANDADVDGDSLTITAVTKGANGNVTIVNGQVRYAPKSGFTGTDTFTYTISDGHGGTATATVAVTVTK